MTTDSSDPAAARAALVRLVRDEGTRVLATLVRVAGDLQLAQDCVQDAAERALRTWPTSGIPDEPRAWLNTVARRRLIDVLRRESSRATKEAAMQVPPHVPGPELSEARQNDDLLRLVFTCCHPSLSTDAQVALSLRVLCGLTTVEVASALLVPPDTMARRLSRAKQKIAAARIPYRVPDDHELPQRLGGVVATIYLLFNEGYAATSGASPQRRDLAAEAIRLARLLRRLMPDEISVMGVLALMLLQEARSATRHDPDGLPILLADQDRHRWDRPLAREGVLLVGDALRRSPDRPDPYVVQAAIAACHHLSPSWEATDWGAIVSWYDVLLTVHDTPVVRLNRAAALALRDGSEVGLEAVDEIDGLGGYPWWHASRAELLALAGRRAEAIDAFRSAMALVQNDSQRRHLQQRLGSI